MATSTKKADSKSKSLASKLSKVSSQAKTLGIDTRRADAMVKQTKRQGSKSFKGSKEEAALNKSFAITPEKLVTQPQPPVPPVPKVTDVGDVVGAGNVGLMGSLDGVTMKDGQFVIPQQVEPTSSTDTTGYEKNMQSYLNNLLGNKPVDNEAIYNKTEKEVGLNRAQRDVNNYTAQLNAITASSQAEQLKLEGQGRGQTSGFIGGEQARINREAAIQALPVQAQLAAAQGNLEFAQQRLDTLFKIRSADAQAKYDFNNKIYSTYYDFANTIQKTKLDALKLKEDRAYEEKKTAIADAKTIAMQAIEYGQSSLAARLMGLDPNSETYARDVASAMAQLRKPVAAPQVGSDWELKDVNGVTSWVNKYTQEVKPVGGTDGTPPKPVKDLEIRDLNDTWTAKNSIVSIVDQMTKSIEDNGTKIFWGSEAGKRGANKTNLLLAMKNLEKTGALDKGTIDVLADLIPENEFWATEDRQIAALNQLKDTIVSKTDEFANSYRGTTAETDPRTKRIYQNSIDTSLFDLTDMSDLDSLFGTSTTTGAFNPASFY